MPIKETDNKLRPPTTRTATISIKMPKKWLFTTTLGPNAHRIEEDEVQDNVDQGETTMTFDCELGRTR
jgi:hypothetical protein